MAAYSQLKSTAFVLPGGLPTKSKAKLKKKSLQQPSKPQKQIIKPQYLTTLPLPKASFQSKASTQTQDPTSQWILPEWPLDLVKSLQISQRRKKNVISGSVTNPTTESKDTKSHHPIPSQAKNPLHRKKRYVYGIRQRTTNSTRKPKRERKYRLGRRHDKYIYRKLSQEKEIKNTFEFIPHWCDVSIKKVSS